MTALLVALLAQTLVGHPAVDMCDNTDPNCTATNITGVGSCPEGWELQSDGSCTEIPPPACNVEETEAFAAAQCPFGFTPINPVTCDYECLPEVGTEYDNVPIPAPGTWEMMPGSVPAAGVLVDGDPSAPWASYCADIECDKAIASFSMWTGCAFDQARGIFMCMAMGGHKDSGSNEIYEYNFGADIWTRPFDPQPRDGPPMYKTSGAIRPECPRPSVGPPATHTYSGALYVPTNGTYPDGLFLVIGASPYCNTGQGYTVDPSGNLRSAWGWRRDTSAWVQLPTIHSGWVSAILDPEGYLVVVDGFTDRMRVYDTADWSIKSTINYGDVFISNMDLDTIDRGDGNMYLYIGNNGQYVHRRTYLPSPDGTPTLGPKENIVPGGQWNSVSVEVHDPTGDVIGWRGGPNVQRWVRATGQTEVLTPPSGPSPGDYSSFDRVYSNWQYHEGLDVFFAIAPDMTVWIYKLP